VIYAEVLGDKIAMYIRVLDCIMTTVFGHILYCGCFNLFCNVWVCVCVGFVMCGCSDNCVGILVICVLVFTVFLFCVLFFVLFRLCIFILICFVCISATTTATS